MRVLLVSHEASRTGAPRVAAMVARSLVDQGHVVEILSRAPGPLLVDFAAVAPTSVEFLHRVRRRLWSVRLARPLAFLVDTALAAVTLMRRRPDLVYVNSTSASIYLRPARWLKLQALLHVHESGTLATHFLRTARLAPGLAGVRLVACSPSVRSELLALTGRAPEEVTMLPSVPDEAAVDRLSAAAPDRPYAESELVVGCCGAVEYRKGADLWVAAAREVSNHCPTSTFDSSGSARSASP